MVSEAVPEPRLDATVAALAARIAGIPRNQLMMQELMINRALDNMGLASTQMLATLFDGIARHTPRGSGSNIGQKTSALPRRCRSGTPANP